MTITIELTKGHVSLIDDVDVDLSDFKWCVVGGRHKDDCYACRRVANPSGNPKQFTTYLHRVVLGRVLGRPMEKGEFVDHVNGNSLDNRRENLRIATNAQNLQNRKRGTNNKSGYKGVTWNKQRNRWQSTITAMGKTYYLGLFATPELAHVAYCAAAKELHGEFARFK